MKSKVVAPVGALSRAQAALYLCCSMRQLDKLARAGKLARLKMGRKSLYRISDLERYLDSLLEQAGAAK